MNIQPGEVRVNKCTLRSVSEEIMALSVDLESKRAYISTWGGDDEGPILMLGADEGTLHTDTALAGELTVLSWPEYAGWSIWSADLRKYTLYVCLVKESN